MGIEFSLITSKMFTNASMLLWSYFSGNFTDSGTDLNAGKWLTAANRRSLESAFFNAVRSHRSTSSDAMDLPVIDLSRSYVVGEELEKLSIETASDRASFKGSMVV